MLKYRARFQQFDMPNALGEVNHWWLLTYSHWLAVYMITKQVLRCNQVRSVVLPVEYGNSFVTQGQFSPPTIVIARFICLCVCVNHKLVRLLTHQPFKLGSPNLDQRCQRPWLRPPMFCGAITLTLYMVLPLFATRFADYAGDIRVSFIQPRLF